MRWKIQQSSSCLSEAVILSASCIYLCCFSLVRCLVSPAFRRFDIFVVYFVASPHHEHPAIYAGATCLAQKQLPTPPEHSADAGSSSSSLQRWWLLTRVPQVAQLRRPSWARVSTVGRWASLGFSVAMVIIHSGCCQQASVRLVALAH